MDVYTAREMHGSDENEEGGPTIDRISVRQDACWRVVRCEYFTKVCLEMWGNAWNGVRMHTDDAAYKNFAKTWTKKNSQVQATAVEPGVAPRCSTRTTCSLGVLLVIIHHYDLELQATMSPMLRCLAVMEIRSQNEFFQLFKQISLFGTSCGNAPCAIGKQAFQKRTAGRLSITIKW